MTKRVLTGALAFFILGALAGALYYWSSWKYHLPYIGLNWLGPLIGADGERGYDAMLYESMIDFGIAFVALFVAISATRSRSQRLK